MMNSEFCSNKHFRLWDRANKYFGLCGLEWIYVKNISTMDIPPLIDQDGVFVLINSRVHINSVNYKMD